MLSITRHITTKSFITAAVAIPSLRFFSPSQGGSLGLSTAATARTACAVFLPLSQHVTLSVLPFPS